MTSMSAILADVSLIVTSACTWVGDFIGVVASQPLLLIFVIVPLCGLGVGLLKRLIRL